MLHLVVAMVHMHTAQVTLHPSFDVINKTGVVYAQGLTGCTGPPGTCEGGKVMNITMNIYYPAQPITSTSKKVPAIVLSHGGGNSGGDNSQYCFIGTVSRHLYQYIILFLIVLVQGPTDSEYI